MSQPKSQQLAALLEEVNLLRADLKHFWAGDNEHVLHEGAGGVLAVIAANGGKTVPQIAKARGTSRQNIQILVNRLKQKGFVEIIENPAHKRSALVRLTQFGLEAKKQFQLTESRFLEALLGNFSEQELVSTTEALHKLRRLTSGQHDKPRALRPSRTARRREPTKPQLSLIEEEEPGLPVNLL